jgi:hypothetical protein
MNILEAKHGLVVGVEGSGKSTYLHAAMKEGARPCVYITLFDDDFGDFPGISICDYFDVTRNEGIPEIPQLLASGGSFYVKVVLADTGVLKGEEYLNDVLAALADHNTGHTVIIDDAVALAAGRFVDTYKRLLDQKAFPVVSAFFGIYEGSEFVVDSAEMVVLFKVSRTSTECFYEKGILTEADADVHSQKVGQYIVRSLD